MASVTQRQEVFDYWNSKNITKHRTLVPAVAKELDKAVRDYGVEYIKEMIDFYATILEPGVPEYQKKYFWTYKWNLFEFLKRGLIKFDGQDLENYKKKHIINSGEAIVLKPRKPHESKTLY